MVITIVTSTTRTPASWDTPAAPWLPILVVHIRSQAKTRQSQNYKFKKNPKNANFKILQETLNATHLLKLLDKKCKYVKDPTRTFGATERTRDAGRMDGGSETKIPTNNFVVRGLNKNNGISNDGHNYTFHNIRNESDKNNDNEIYSNGNSNNHNTNTAKIAIAILMITKTLSPLHVCIHHDFT